MTLTADRLIAEKIVKSIKLPVLALVNIETSKLVLTKKGQLLLEALQTIEKG